MKNVLTLCIIPSLLLCSFQKESELAPNGYLVVENTAKKADRIMYLFFKADTDQSGSEKIVLQESKVSEGRMKTLPSFDRNQVQNGDFIITVFAEDGIEASKHLIKDPLHPELEVYEKEGVSRHKASLPHAEFSVRFPYSESIRSVKIEKVMTDGVQLIFTQKLSS